MLEIYLYFSSLFPDLRSQYSSTVPLSWTHPKTSSLWKTCYIAERALSFTIITTRLPIVIFPLPRCVSWHFMPPFHFLHLYNWDKNVYHKIIGRTELNWKGQGLIARLTQVHLNSHFFPCEAERSSVERQEGQEGRASKTWKFYNRSLHKLTDDQAFHLFWSLIIIIFWGFIAAGEQGISQASSRWGPGVYPESKMSSGGWWFSFALRLNHGEEEESGQSYTSSGLDLSLYEEMYAWWPPLLCVSIMHIYTRSVRMGLKRDKKKMNGQLKGS